MEFEKHFLTQLKAVGHRVSSRSLINQTESGNETLSTKTVPSSLNTNLSKSNAGFYLRAQIDYTFSKESQDNNDNNNKLKNIFAFKSGDLFYVLDSSDPKWWKVSFGEKQNLFY